MIPASYLYKDIYRQTWLDPDIECARARAQRAPKDGLRRRLGAFAAALGGLLHLPWAHPAASFTSDPC